MTAAQSSLMPCEFGHPAAAFVHRPQRRCVHKRTRALVRACVVALLIICQLRRVDGAVVRDAVALQAALRDREAHIVVEQHLDVAQLELQTDQDKQWRRSDGYASRTSDAYLLFVQGPTRSIQGNCSGTPPSVEPPAAPLRPLMLRQCVLTADARLLFITHQLVNSVDDASPEEQEQSLWLARLYLRFQDSSREKGDLLVDVFGLSTVYMEEVTLQGDSTMENTTADEWSRAVGIVHGSRVLMQDCKVVDFVGYKVSGIGVYDEASLSISNSVFDHMQSSEGVVVMNGDGVALRVVSTNFTRYGGAPVKIWSTHAIAYLNSSLVQPVNGVGNLNLRGISETPEAGRFATADDAVLAAIKREASQAAHGQGNSSDPSTLRKLSGFVALGCAAAAVIVLAVVTVRSMLVRRRLRAAHLQSRSMRSMHASQGASARHDDSLEMPSQKRSLFACGSPVEGASFSTEGAEGERENTDTGLAVATAWTAPSNVGCGLLSTGVGDSSTPDAAWRTVPEAPCHGTRSINSTGTSHASQCTTLRTPAANMSRAVPAPFTRIQEQLHRLYMGKVTLFTRFSITGVGAEHQRLGGQALVQFVEDIRTRVPLAAKFFTREADFEREQELYRIPALRAAMPRFVYAQKGGWVPGKGDWDEADALPPCLVMDRGESLAEYVHAAGYNIFSTVHALGQVLQKLHALHAAGWVHRDLKPSNLLWNPNRRTWMLLDFGFAAPTGARARLAFSTRYAAPEVLHAKEQGRASMVVLSSLDIWAFGIIAFEMLTERPLFPLLARKETIMDALLGHTPMPWEDSTIGEMLLQKLGIFKDSVMSCLRRSPEERVESVELLDMWKNLFASQSGSATAR